MLTNAADVEPYTWQSSWQSSMVEVLCHNLMISVEIHQLQREFLQKTNLIFCSPTIEPKLNLVKGIREALLHHLTIVLGDDELAAHFLLLHLLSKVHARVDSFTVGKLSLNLTGFNKESISAFGNRIGDAVNSLIPFTHRMPLTVEYLNTASLAPVKYYQTNKLLPGVLQFAEGSHLTIDETPLQTGTLNTNGVENARLLKDLMEFQKVLFRGPMNSREAVKPHNEEKSKKARKRNNIGTK